MIEMMVLRWKRIAVPPGILHAGPCTTFGSMNRPPIVLLQYGRNGLAGRGR